MKLSEIPRDKRKQPHSEEHKRKISQALSGHKVSDETKEAIKAGLQKYSQIFSQQRRGENNPSWKGGRRLTEGGSGYVIIYQGIRQYKYEHVLVWEKVHNQKLPGDWTIHHLNGIKTDNRPENLLAMPRKNHYPGLVNQALKQCIRELEAKVGLLEKVLSTQQITIGEN